MKKFPLVLLLAAAVFNSCGKDNDNVKKDTGRRIIPVVSAPAQFKSSDQAAALETRVIKAGDYDLVETVYDWDNAPNTKAANVVDSGNIDEFFMDQYWNDGRGPIFTKANVVGSGSGWSLAGITDEQKKWHNVPTTFWSYKNVSSIAVGDNVSKAVVAGIDASKDIIFAYNNENRDHEGAHNDELHISFKHALALIEFDAASLPDGYKITDITISGFSSSANMEVTPGPVFSFDSYSDPT